MKEFIYSVNKDSWNQNVYQEIIKIFLKIILIIKFLKKRKVTQQIYQNNFSFFKK